MAASARPPQTKRPQGKPRTTGPRPVAVHPAVVGVNNEAERALLGAMMLTWEAFEAATDALTPEDFFEPRHQLMFEALSECPRVDDGVIGVVALDEQLKRSGTLGRVTQTYVHQLVNACEDSYQYAGHLRIVLECSLERQKQNVGAQLTQGDITPAECITRLQAIEARRERVLTGAVRTLGIVASSVQPEPIRWLWKRRLARGKLAIMDGDGGLGKGHVTIDLAARKSAGRSFPGDLGITQAPGAVILISPEDDIADTLVPRLIAAKADLSRIHILNTITDIDPETGRESERSVTIPRDIPHIEALATQTGAELLIVDPILGCLDAGVKTGIDSEVRSALMPLKHLATRTGMAVLLVRHLNKSGGDNALYRGGGSVAFGALCRTVLLVAEHPDNTAKRVLLPVKNNLSTAADGLTFAVTSDDPDGVAWVNWETEPCEMHPSDVLGNGAKRSAEAREMLEALRSDALTLPAKPSEIAAVMGIEADDKTGINRVTQRLRRMQKSGLIISPAYGVYSLPPIKHHT